MLNIQNFQCRWFNSAPVPRNQLRASAAESTPCQRRRINSAPEKILHSLESSVAVLMWIKRCQQNIADPMQKFVNKEILRSRLAILIVSAMILLSSFWIKIFKFSKVLRPLLQAPARRKYLHYTQLFSPLSSRPIRQEESAFASLSRPPQASPALASRPSLAAAGPCNMGRREKKYKRRLRHRAFCGCFKLSDSDDDLGTTTTLYCLLSACLRSQQL